MKPITPLQHRIIAAAAIVVMFALAGANYAKHGTRGSRTVEAFVAAPPVVQTDTVTTSPILTETASVPPPCESRMAELQQGQPTDVVIAPGLTRRFLEPGGGISETLVRAEFLDAFWPGRRLLLLHDQWTNGASRGDSTALIGCEGDQLTMLESASGPPVFDGIVLRILVSFALHRSASEIQRARTSRWPREADSSLDAVATMRPWSKKIPRCSCWSLMASRPERSSDSNCAISSSRLRSPRCSHCDGISACGACSARSFLSAAAKMRSSRT